MEIYIFCLLIFLVASTFSKRNWAVWPIGILLTIFVGLRDISVGTDTVNYSVYFQILSNGGAITSEYLFGLLNRIVINVNGEFVWVQCAAAILTIFPVFYVIYKKSPFPYLSIFLYITLYLYFYSFNIVRQCISISICFFAISFFLRNKLWFFSLIIIAVNFHTSAIVMAPLYFIDKVRLNGAKILIALVGSFVIGIFLPSTVIYLISFFGYSNYLSGSFALGSLFGNMFYLIILNAFFFAVYKFEKNKSIAFFSLFFMFLVVTNLLIRFPFGNRIILYFSIFQILYFPNLLSRLPRKERSMMFIFIVIYALFIFFNFYGNGEIFPYKSVLSVE